MMLGPKSTLSAYEIISPIGKGGMGEVYLARDPKLDRDVAIKVLPESMARDKERVARFEREAKLLASLNHPNIAAIHGFDEADGTRFLVMEYVEGVTLAQRLRGGAFAVEDTLDIGKQMAEDPSGSAPGDSPTITAMSGTEGARHPFFSPDGQWIGFFASGRLRKVSVSGGAPISLCEARGDDRGGTWGADGTIIFVPNVTTGLWRVPDAGGAARQITERAKDERSHRWPHWLPGGRAVLFASQKKGSDFDDASIEVLNLETHERRVLHHGGSYGRYLPTGHRYIGATTSPRTENDSSGSRKKCRGDAESAETYIVRSYVRIRRPPGSTGCISWNAR